MAGERLEWRVASDGWRVLAFLMIGMFLATPVVSAEEAASQPSAKRGFIRVVNGLVLEWPKTIVESTKQGPPIVGTMVGAVAGFSRAVVEVVEGTVEMAGGVSARPSR